MKGISKEDFLNNCLGESSNRSLRMRTMTVSERYPAIHLEGYSNILPNFGSEFSRTKNFCFENWIFYSHSAYAYVRESVRTRDMGLGM